MSMKYIITRHGTPVIFGEAENHSDVAEGVGAISAGFVDIRLKHVIPKELGDDTMEIHVHCSGQSYSLGGLQSRPEKDAEIIKRAIERY